MGTPSFFKAMPNKPTQKNKSSKTAKSSEFKPYSIKVGGKLMSFKTPLSFTAKLRAVLADMEQLTKTSSRRSLKIKQ